jgi:hypothetical protein
LEEARDKVEKELREKKAGEKAESAAEGLLAEVKGGKPMKEAATSKGLKVEETGLFTKRTNYIPKIGSVEGLVEVISPLDAEHPFPEGRGNARYEKVRNGEGVLGTEASLHER